MKAVLFTILKRNGIVSALLIASLIGLRFIPRQIYWPAAIIVFFGGLVSFIWAFRSLEERIGRIAVGGLTALVAIIVGFISLVLSVLIGREVIDFRYRAAGYEMRRGCNLSEANSAEFALFELSNRIEELRQDSPTDNFGLWQLQEENAATKKRLELWQLQKEYAATKKRLEFLKADIRLRGHRDTFPVLSNANKSMEGDR